MNKKKKLILVDIDNTLVNTGSASDKAISKTLQDFFQIDYNSVSDQIEIMRRSRPQDLTAEHPLLHKFIAFKKSKKTCLKTLYKAHKSYQDLLMDQIQEMPGARKFLQACLDAKIPTVAITNNFLVFALERLVKTDLHNFFDNIITPEVYGIPKPHPFLFQTILKDYKVTPKETLMIGDNIVTDGGSKSIGIDFFLLQTENTEKQYSSLISKFVEC